MRILIVTTSYPLGEDGSEAAGSFVKDFARVLGHHNDVGVVYPSDRITEEIPESKEGIRQYPFKVPSLPLSLLSPVNVGSWKKILDTINSGGRMVDKAVKHFAPEHVFALWALPSGYWAMRAKKRYGVPYSVWTLGSDIWTLGKIPLVRSVIKQVLCKASHRYADGYQLLSDMQSLCAREGHFLPSTRVLVVKKQQAKRSAPPYRLAFLGRWHRNKGIDLLLEALQLMAERDWTRIDSIVVAGGGPMSQVVEKSVKLLQAQGRPIELRGFLDNQAATELMQQTDYLLIPSRIESIPVVFSDALQTGTPMVVTPVGDMPALFQHDAPGQISGELTPSEYATAISRALDHPPRKYEQCIKNKMVIFDLEKIVTHVTNRLLHA